jgi:splicing factor 3B subunit 2
MHLFQLDCQYGYHPGGWGKPPLDQYNRPMYGGNLFDPPGTSGGRELDGNGFVPVTVKRWPRQISALPTGYLEGGRI